MQNFSKINLMVLLLLPAACGNPLALDKELEREQARKEALVEEKANLSEDNHELRRTLRNAFVFDGKLWTSAAVAQSKEQALQTCEEIGFRLPTHQEATAAIGQTFTFGNRELPIERVYRSDREVEGKAELHFTFCVKENAAMLENSE